MYVHITTTVFIKYSAIQHTIIIQHNTTYSSTTAVSQSVRQCVGTCAWKISNFLTTVLYMRSSGWRTSTRSQYSPRMQSVRYRRYYSSGSSGGSSVVVVVVIRKRKSKKYVSKKCNGQIADITQTNLVMLSVKCTKYIEYSLKN